MAERKIWKAQVSINQRQEDKILKELYQERGIKKWTEISRIMEKDYGMWGRNGKQCRERYHNHLEEGIRKQKWQSEEEERLVQLHGKLGNRWAMISKLIPGRTDNCVKNMLYSRFRKAVRYLNRVQNGLKRFNKPVNISFIHRLIQISEAAYQTSPLQRSDNQKRALEIKQSILTLNLNEDYPIQQDQEGICRLIEDIHKFSKANRRVSGSRKIRISKGQLLTFVQISDQEPQTIEKSCINQTLTNFLPLLKEEVKQSQIIDTLNVKKAKRMESIQSNHSWLFDDPCLQKPIQVEQGCCKFNLTPQGGTQSNNNWHSYLNQWNNHDHI